MSSRQDSLTGQSESDFCYYQVKPGDSLSSIAAHFGYVTPTQLGKINSLPFSGCSLPNVFPGQTLIIPTVSKSSVVIPKVRRAPGTALRVRAASDIVKSTVHEHTSANGFKLQDIYTVRRELPQRPVNTLELEDVDDTLTRKFVKLSAKYVYITTDTDGGESMELIDGVLLITPDLLCFDTATTAQAQKEAFADHGHQEMEEAKQQGDLEKDKQPELSKKKMSSFKLGSCVPLSQITSMSTMRSIRDIYKVLEMTNREALSRPRSSFADPTTCILHQQHMPVETFDERDPLHGDQRLNNDDTASPPAAVDSSGVPTPVAQNGKVTADRIAEKDDGSAFPPDRPVDPCCASADDVFSEEVPSDVASSSGLQKFVYLWLTASAGSRGLSEIADSPTEYIYQIPTNEISDVCNFLLRAGVGPAHRETSSSSTKAIDPVIGVQRRLTVSDSSANTGSSSVQLNDRSLARHSMIEEMLQSMENSNPMPVLYGGKSGILTDDMLEELGANLPVHWIGSNLALVYSTEVDGYSLATLYRKSNDVKSSVLLVLRDTMGTVFGAIMSERMHYSQHFYGTGESCVFHWLPEFKRYDWTKKNYYFMRGSPNCFHIGGQNGRSAIWFDEALKYGRSEPTDTFNNPVLSGCLPEFHVPASEVLKQEMRESSETVDRHEQPTSTTPAAIESVPFIIDSLEVWELIS